MRSPPSLRRGCSWLPVPFLAIARLNDHVFWDLIQVDWSSRKPLLWDDHLRTVLSTRKHVTFMALKQASNPGIERSLVFFWCLTFVT